ncbi:MAG: hypothetical protein J6U42_05400, partial [Lachnospiraceae bacterium]|nr:hypothetical protein [Lachnospiraceae bacterium]
MIILIWIRFFAELCLYFGVALSFPKAFKTGLNPFVPVLVLSLSIALAYVLSEKGHTKLKLLTCLIPVGLMLLICRSLGDVFVMIPAAVYTLLVIIRDAQKTEYYGYLFVFKRVVAAAGGLFIALLLVEEAFKRAGALSEVVHAAPLGIYGLIYAALGVVLLKALRLGDDLKKQNMNLQLIELFVPVLIVLAAALVIFGGRSAKDLLRTGLEMLLAPLVMLGDALVSTEDKGYAEKRMEAEAAANTENEGGALTGVLTTPEAAQVAEAARDNSMLVSVLLRL